MAPLNFKARNMQRIDVRGRTFGTQQTLNGQEW